MRLKTAVNVTIVSLTCNHKAQGKTVFMAARTDIFLDIAHNQRVYRCASGKNFIGGSELSLLESDLRKQDRMKRKLYGFFQFSHKDPLYAMHSQDRGSYQPVLITLTYPSNDHWAPEHITQFVNHVRNYMDRTWGIRMRYAWVAETTKRGVIHYHLTVWVPRGKKLPKPDDSGWWPHGLSEIALVKKGIQGYLMKYLTKGILKFVRTPSDQSKPSRSPRMFACGGLSPRDSEFLSHQMLPAYVKDIFGGVPFGERIRRVSGGWECGNTFVAGNFEWAWHPFDRCVHAVFGVAWSPLPDDPVDVYIPF